jgi:hypothetical protein
MTAIPIYNRAGAPIRSLEDWFFFAPPKKRAAHWKDGRSAKELAKAWLRDGPPQMPYELDALLRTHPATEGFIPEVAIAECVTHLDDFRGEQRNHDLIILGHVGDHQVLIAIESKADEEFGREIRRMKGTSPRSNILARIDLLTRSLFGRSVDGLLERLRYQLLTGSASALIEAKNRAAERAVFIIHEFVSAATDAQKIARNAADYQRFVRAFAGLEKIEAPPGILIGDIAVPGGLYVPGDVPLLIGKLRTPVVLTLGSL